MDPWFLGAHHFVGFVMLWFTSCSLPAVFFQLEALQNRLEASEANTADKLRHLEQVQQLAIEYSMSSGPGSPQPSPTVHRSKSDSHQPSKIPQLVTTYPTCVSPTVTLADSGRSHLPESRNSPVIVNGDSTEMDSFLVVSSVNDEITAADSESEKLRNSSADTEMPKVKVDTLMPASVSNSE